MHPIFQSPLHRGNHFNRGDIFTGMSKTLNFSPLFIGEITSTWPLLNRRTQRLLISVPSSSGKSLQPARQRFYFQCDTSSHKESVSQTSFLQKIRGGLRNLRRRAAEDSGRLFCTWL